MSLSLVNEELLSDFNNRILKIKSEFQVELFNERKDFLALANKKTDANFYNNNCISKMCDSYCEVITKNNTLGIDKKTDKKLVSGNYHIDYKLDLHNLSFDSAYEKLFNLFELSIIYKYRCLLIITGKGIHSKNSETIKSLIQVWLKQPYFSNKIIKYTDATLKHGGSGAIYILLKKKYL